MDVWFNYNGLIQAGLAAVANKQEIFRAFSNFNPCSFVHSLPLFTQVNLNVMNHGWIGLARTTLRVRGHHSSDDNLE